jgi:hypothetical protein
VPGAGDAGFLAYVRGRHDVRFDGRFEAIDVRVTLDEAHGIEDGMFVGDVLDLLVVREPVAQLVVERILGSFSDRAHAYADLGKRADEVLLVRGEPRLDENDVRRHEDVSRL